MKIFLRSSGILKMMNSCSGAIPTIAAAAPNESKRPRQRRRPAVGDRHNPADEAADAGDQGCGTPVHDESFGMQLSVVDVHQW